MSETTQNGTNSSASKENLNGQADTPSASPESRVQELEAQVKDKEGKYVYLYAEFENFKKRAVKERSELVKFGWEAVARDLLQVLDNIDRAIQFAPAGLDKNFLDGLKLVQQQFKSSLERQGVQAIITEAQAFDPNLHEAVGQIPSKLPSGTIAQEASRGYTLHGRLLRPSRVLLSGGPEVTETA